MAKRGPYATGDPGAVAKERARCRRKYKKNRKALIAYAKEHRHFRLYYAASEETRSYIQARLRLRRLCRPDLISRDHDDRSLPRTRIYFDAAVVEEAERIYKRKLMELRKLHGRDPITGRLPKGKKDVAEPVA